MVDAEIPDLHLIGRPVLAKDGCATWASPVAVVVATDPYLAADAVSMVEIDVEPLEAAADVMTAVQHEASSQAASPAGSATSTRPSPRLI